MGAEKSVISALNDVHAKPPSRQGPAFLAAVHETRELLNVISFNALAGLPTEPAQLRNRALWPVS
ncbi:MAG TPA: hypothetical protein PKL67_06620, partial [Anaerolineae bacterium]|nr:hypothetical protein [Anaerolineae bacterium]